MAERRKDIKIRIIPDFKQTLKVCPIEIKKNRYNVCMINHEYEVAVFLCIMF